MIGRSPIGEWELAFADDGANRALFAQESVEDLLLVVTYAAQTAEWPGKSGPGQRTRKGITDGLAGGAREGRSSRRCSNR